MRAQAQLPSSRPALLRQPNTRPMRAGGLGSIQPARRSAFNGSALRPSPLRPLHGKGGPSIHGAVCRKAGKTVICAVLADVEGPTTDVHSLLETEVKPTDELVTGQLDNGLRYAIMPNKLPPQRFEAHMEINAGSVDELPGEQGMAHLVEHVTFLGSKKRESLLGTGARANAYTDFHHTVFHVHAPLVNSITGRPMLPQVLDALDEIAFNAEFDNYRISKERKAVQAEAQMMNTIEYRVDCQLLQHLHYENHLGCRFPIGRVEQVDQWSRDQLLAFWKKWYFPGNATLYVVGDLDRSTAELEELIKQTYGKRPPGMVPAGLAAAQAKEYEAAGPGHTAPFFAPPPGSVGGNGNGAASPEQFAAQQLLMKERHPVRPPVKHRYGVGPLQPGEKPAEVGIFRHSLLHHFMCSIFCKMPIQPMTKMGHLRQLFMLRIILSVFQFRVNKRYAEANPPFIGIELDISDSGREGCAVSTLTVSSEPSDWEGALAVAIQEIRRLQRHGINQGELERYTNAIMRDSSQLAEQANKIPSLDTLNYVMESLACGNHIMDHKESHEAMAEVAATITLDAINPLARSLLTFASDYGNEAAVLEDAARNPGKYGHQGPTRATSIVTCIPAYTDVSGLGIQQEIDMGLRRQGLGAGGHLDADTIDVEALKAENQKLLDEGLDVPEGAMKFDVPPADIARVLADQSYEVNPLPDIVTPKHLVPPEEMDAKVQQYQPKFVPLEEGSTEVTPAPDPDHGIVQRKLSNGMLLNYRVTDHEPKSAIMRLIAPGGRASEKMGVGPDGFGAVVLGARALSECGIMGPWGREAIEVFCVTHLITCALDADEENIMMDFHFSVDGGSMTAVFEMLHLIIGSPTWDEASLERAKTAFLSSIKSTGKSLERASGERIMNAMLGGPEIRRFREPTPEELDALTLEGCQKAFKSLFHPGNLELSVVGDFEPAELEHNVLRFVGSLPPLPPQEAAPIDYVTVTCQSPPAEERHSVWHLQDSDERASAFVAGMAPARWGPLDLGYNPLPPLQKPIKTPVPVIPLSLPPEQRQALVEERRRHPLFSSCALMIITEIMNSRLFTTVRDSLGLTYDVSFEITMFDRVRAGWFSVHVTSHPDRIFEALDASVAVLRDFAVSPITRRELDRAKTTVLTRHESDLKDNVYWLGLLTHLLNPHVPYKNIECLRDLKALYESLTVDDMYLLYSQLKLDDNSIFTCVGTSGKSAPPPPPANRRFGGGFSDIDEEVLQQQKVKMPNPVELWTAMMAASQVKNMQKALNQQKQGGGDK